MNLFQLFTLCSVLRVCEIYHKLRLMYSFNLLKILRLYPQQLVAKKHCDDFIQTLLRQTHNIPTHGMCLSVTSLILPVSFSAPIPPVHSNTGSSNKPSPIPWNYLFPLRQHKQRKNMVTNQIFPDLCEIHLFHSVSLLFFFLVIQTDFQFSVELYVIQLSIQSEIYVLLCTCPYVFPIGTYNFTVVLIE